MGVKGGRHAGGGPDGVGARCGRAGMLAPVEMTHLLNIIVTVSKILKLQIVTPMGKDVKFTTNKCENKFLTKRADADDGKDNESHQEEHDD